ncbi:glycerophosphoryl diester phosphodiesterase [Murinocardiopsis flavida]|uniref:Glycerophosphoryl diester phosphodiesterase n=1 Tax=Murinocardiopsis flavida TaxID=645275 RepID=A0A2P8DHC7_9ACTN|nr:glycerophosphodiester phosphodiesterase family protein [Murinocardiopsis flavida]PSK96603.1 glycerophosphoryl diester phosphodiesterase [Murinocardiopsis flavida]
MISRIGVVATVAACALVGSAGAAAAAPADTQGERERSAVVDVAHRGASAYAPENTIAAIDEAKARGAGTVEVDVQRSKDGKLVLFHDLTMERTTDVEKVYPGRDDYRVGDFTLRQLRKLDAGSWFDASYKGERIPTLEEGLRRLKHEGLNLLLEQKAPERYPGIEKETADLLKKHPWWLAGNPSSEPNRLAIQSFDHASVKRSHDRLPDVPHGLLGKVAKGELGKVAKWADQVNPDHKKIDAAYVKAVHKKGMEVYVYTVNEPADMRTAIGAGVDGIISDVPDVLLKVIEEQRLP